MVHVPSPSIPTRSGLWSLAFKLESIGFRFLWLYEDIRDIWLIGVWLSTPFYVISGYFFSARDFAFEADNWLAKVWYRVEGIFNGDIIREIIDTISYHYSWLRENPINWIVYHLQQFSWEMSQLINNPIAWFLYKLQDVSPELWDIAISATNWLRDKFEQLYPSITSFLYDPYAFIYDKVIQLFPIIWSLMYYPTDTILGWLYDRYYWLNDLFNDPKWTIWGFLKQISYELSSFLDDPSFWFRHKLASLLGLSVGQLSNLPYYLSKIVFDTLAQNYWGILDTMKTRLCDIILHFI
jgi:hypothetical protein